MNQYNLFIEENKKKSISEISLLLSKKKDWPKTYIINQINGKQKARVKFLSFLEYEDIFYPTPKSVEQASSEQTAEFKASLFSGENMVDLSGGMGVDSLFFAKRFKQLTYVEPNADLCKNFIHNAEVLGLENLKIIQQDALSALNASKQFYDLVYIDPDRRDGQSRLFKIEDCEPKLSALLPLIWEKSKALLIKLSPMLDIKQLLKELPNSKTVYVVALKNEVKELLVYLEKDFRDECQIKCINLESNQAEFKFQFSEEETVVSEYSTAKKYLYDPNVAILKAGAFKVVAQKYELQKLAINTHLYTSDELIHDFPGRIFEVQKEVHPKEYKNQKANVITKNHSLKAEQIKAKYRIKDGGEHYLIGFRDNENKDVIYSCLRMN